VWSRSCTKEIKRSKGNRMPVPMIGLRVFFASPGGLDAERELFCRTIEEFNRKRAVDREFLFIPVMSGLLTGGQGRAQSRINAKLEECDYCIIMFWNQWGSPPGGDEGYSSGTEEEYYKAVGYAGDGKKPMDTVVLFFKQVSEGELKSPGEELRKVLEFKAKIGTSCQYIDFSGEEDLKEAIEKHLEEWLRCRERKDKLPKGPPRDVLDYEKADPE